MIGCRERAAVVLNEPLIVAKVLKRGEHLGALGAASFLDSKCDHVHGVIGVADVARKWNLGDVLYRKFCRQTLIQGLRLGRVVVNTGEWLHDHHAVGERTGERREGRAGKAPCANSLRLRTSLFYGLQRLSQLPTFSE